MTGIHFFKSCLLTCTFLCGSAIPTLAQTDKVEGMWLNEEATAKVQIYKAKDGKLYGKIMWLKEPEKDGKPRTDEKNPEAKKRIQPLIGLLILKGFVKDGANEYEDGTIYDPKNGKTYSCVMTLEDRTLRVRGYVGISMLGRTTRWTRTN